MDEAFLKRAGDINPFLDQLEAELKDHDIVYLNDKEQLIRIVKLEKDGRVKDIHNILAFDVTKLP